MATKIKIGDKLEGGDVTLNVESLIYSRALIQANSGGGKSGLMRVIAEQVAAKIPTIIIDKEGEYHTLREKLDIVLVGERGEIAANVRSAGLLARKLVELGASAVCDLYELKLPQQREWVKNFVESLMSLPKNLWHPTLVLIDECDVFAPEKGFGDSEATDAVIDLMARGRKHGLCGIPATQRLSKLHKNVAAEVNNVFIGRTWLDTDQSRAGKMLGLSSSGALILRDFKTREFQAFGPALEENGVIHFRVADCQTTIPKPGDHAALVPPKASHVVTEIAEKLKDLPQQAEAEIKTLADAQAKVRELQRQLKTAAPDPKLIERSIANALSQAETQFASLQRENVKAINDLRGRLDKIAQLASLNGNAPAIAEYKPIAPRVAVDRPAPMPQKQASADSGSIGQSGLRRILVALAQRPQGMSTRQIGVRAGLSSKSGSFNTYMSRARSGGWVVGDRGHVQITDEGLTALGDYDPLPTGDALLQHWLSDLGDSGASRILSTLAEAYPRSLTKHEVAERASLSGTSGSFNTYLSRLRSLELIEGKGELRASEELFD